MRLFVAIPLPAEIRERLIETVERLGRPGDGLPWQSPESWHITLQFLGNADQERYVCLLTRLKAVHASAFTVRIKGLSSFQRPGTLFLEIEQTPQLLHIQQKVATATEECGFVAESRPYRPHISLARRARASQSSNMQQLPIATDRIVPKSFMASEFVLFESFLSAAGSRYEVRERVALSASA